MRLRSSLLSQLPLKHPLRLQHFFRHLAESFSQLVHNLNDASFLLGTPLVTRSANSCIIFFSQCGKVTTLNTTLKAVTRLRVDVEAITLEPDLLLVSRPRKLLPAPFSIEDRVHIPVSRAHAVVLLLDIGTLGVFMVDE